MIMFQHCLLFFYVWSGGVAIAVLLLFLSQFLRAFCVVMSLTLQRCYFFVYLYNVFMKKKNQNLVQFSHLMSSVTSKGSRHTKGSN